VTETATTNQPETVGGDSPKEPIPLTVRDEKRQPGSILVLGVEVPEQVVTERVETVLQDLRKEASIPGFRRGRAPLDLVRRRLGKAARGEAVARVVPQCVEQIVEERKIQSFGEPRIQELKSEPGDPVTFDVHLEVKPELELPDLAEIEVTVEERPVTDQLVADQLEHIRRANAVLTPKKGKVAKSDAVVVDLDATDHQGQEAKQLAAHDTVIRLGEEDQPAPDEVIAALTGRTAGEHFTVQVPRKIHVDDPETGEHRHEDVTWTWRVAVKEVKSVTLPDLDDEFAKDVGDFESLDDLRGKIRADLEGSEARRQREETIDATLGQLLERVSFDAPVSLVAQAQLHTFQRDSEYLKAMGMKFSDLGQETESYVESTRKDAVERVRADLILHAIGEQAKIEVADADIDAAIERMAEQAGRKPLAIRAQLEARKQLDDLRGRVRQEKLREHIAGAVKVKRTKPRTSGAKTAKAPAAKAKSPKRKAGASSKKKSA
jgi:trigger factor